MPIHGWAVASLLAPLYDSSHGVKFIMSAGSGWIVYGQPESTTASMTWRPAVVDS